MAKFAILGDGLVWVEINSIAMDIADEITYLLDNDSISEHRIIALADVAEELLDKRDLTYAARRASVTEDTNSEVDSTD